MNRAKELLRKVKLYDTWIDRNTKERQRLNEMAVNITANFSSDPVQGTKNGDRIGSAVAKIVDLENRICADTENLVALKAEIQQIMKKIEMPDYVKLLDKRYFEYKTWPEIAEEMHFTCRWVLVIHGRALQAFEAEMDGGKDAENNAAGR